MQAVSNHCLNDNRATGTRV